MKKFKKRLTHILPWCVACGIFAYLFHLYPLRQVLKALQYVQLPIFGLFAIAYFSMMFLYDSWVITRMISRFSHAISYADAFIGRGATYLVMVLNYPASQAAYAYYLKRLYGIPIFQVLGIFLLIVFVDIIWIVSLALAGSLFQEVSVAGLPLGRIVQITACVVYAMSLCWIAFWRRWPERILKREMHWAFIERLRSRRVFHIFNMARTRDYLTIALLRTPIHVTIIVAMYILLRTFHAEIPFLQILGNIPIVFLVGALPITPGGLGTTNAVMVELLQPHLSGSVFATGAVTPGELIFAASLLWMFVNYAMKALVGMTLIHRVSRKLFLPTPDVPEEKAEHEAAHLGGNY